MNVVELEVETTEKYIVTLTQNEVDALAEHLDLHGRITQKRLLHVLQNTRANRVEYLVKAKHWEDLKTIRFTGIRKAK